MCACALCTLRQTGSEKEKDTTKRHEKQSCLQDGHHEGNKAKGSGLVLRPVVPHLLAWSCLVAHLLGVPNFRMLGLEEHDEVRFSVVAPGMHHLS